MRTFVNPLKKLRQLSRVLIIGPSGSGKELAARTSQSARSGERFVVAMHHWQASALTRVIWRRKLAKSSEGWVFEQAHHALFDEICDFYGNSGKNCAGR